eukprot:5930282-Amphidinium_carterae.1
MGDYPMEREEVTDGQLSAFKRWLDLGHVPSADFGIWGPHGARTERRLRFTSHVMVGGAWKMMEVPGPDCLETWQQCWRVYRTAAIMCEVASPSTLDRYAA